MQRESSRAVRGRRPSVPIPSRPPLRRERAKAEEPPPSVTAEEKQPQEEEEGETKASKRRRKDGEQAAQKEQQQKQQLRPRPPVGPRMSYVFFCAAKREDVAAENPYRSPTERNRILAQMWRSMHLDEREPYIARQKQDRIRYHREMTEFVRAVQLYEAQHSRPRAAAPAAPAPPEPPLLERSDTQGSVLLND